MSSQWTNKHAIMRDLSLAQGCVPIGILSTISAQDKPPALNIVEETEESFFKNSVADGDFAAPDLALIKSMLDMALDKDCTSDDDDEDIQKLIQTSKLNPTVSPFVSFKLKATLQNGITTKIINGGAAGDGEPKDITTEPKLTVTEPKGDPSERKWFTAEPTLITAEPTVFINEPKLNTTKPKLNTTEPKLNTTEPKLFAFDPEQAMKGPKLVSKTKKPPRNVAMASFLESIGVDQSPKLLTDEKEPKQLKTVLLKPDHFTVTAETVEKPEHTKLVDETSSGNFDNSNTFVNEKLDNLLDNSKQVATPKKGLLRLKPGSMFKRKTTPPESPATTPEPTKHKQTSTVNTLKMYTPSKWAAQYYKTYTERANMQVILNEDVWARAERQMKEIDAKRKLERLKLEAAQNEAMESSDTSKTIIDDQPDDTEES